MGGMMSKHLRMNKNIKAYWSKKLNLHDDVIEKISQEGFFTFDCSSSPLILVAVCSLLRLQNPIHKVIDSIYLFTIECITLVFNDFFFVQLDKTIRELNLSGFRSHVRYLRRIGRVIATMKKECDWKDQWTHDTDHHLISSIRDEPFLPQRG
jgi:hypothetical protein